MTEDDHAPEYALGSTDAEHERLMRQAQRLAPLTERFLREAGITTGQRVLDLGSGLGDVAMLAARIVGPSGEVVGVELDSHSIAKARTRVGAAGFQNVRFIESDVGKVSHSRPFDAAFGRFILEFVPDPVSVLRNVSKAVRPGGTMAFQEVSWAHLLAQPVDLPLWAASASLARETLARSGANVDIGFALNRIFLDAGLPAPTMNMEMQLGTDQASTQWLYDFLYSLRPQIQKQDLPLDSLGDFETLPQRLYAEVTGSKAVIPVAAAIVGAWCHKPL